ncbi:hypothetical protein COLO4_35148 [Corchorus olitorius]|uniref:Uncharacterized protein n=1 Tax=Corchorus olitorius TaxID=93759 RepID=A0A1R3GI44_9ROSI|nr:hypothetical protein COLO4_35148 [Corchorus olitorius]
MADDKSSYDVGNVRAINNLHGIITARARTVNRTFAVYTARARTGD